MKDAINALLAGNSLNSLPIGRHEGRFDLRASWLVSTRGVNDPALAGRLGAVPTLRNTTIADIDFAASTARLNLDGCVMVNCVLDRAGWQGWSVRCSHIEDCSFVRADLRDSHFDARNDIHTPAGRSRDDHGARSIYRQEITGVPAWTNSLVKTTRSRLPSMAGPFPRSPANGQASGGSDTRAGCSRSWE
jgi:hypothetical protein